MSLQTRQSPVLTSFTPGANPYTGLASCVSLNTAVAMRVGKRHITFQFQQERPQLRVDVVAVSLANDIKLGGEVDAHPMAQALGPNPPRCRIDIKYSTKNLPMPGA